MTIYTNSILITSGFPGDSIKDSVFSRNESSVKVGSSSSTPSGVLLSSSVANSTFFYNYNFAAAFFSSTNLLTFIFFSKTYTKATFSVASKTFSMAALSSIALKITKITIFALSASFYSTTSTFLHKQPALHLKTTMFSTLASATKISFSLFTLSSFLRNYYNLTKTTSLTFSTSPSLITRAALLSFLTNTAHRHFFFYSSLHSSLDLSTTAFFITPTVTYSSDVLWAESSFFGRSIFFVPGSLTVA